MCRLVLLLLAALLTGCSDSGKKSVTQVASKNDLMLEVVGLIRSHCAARGKGPQKISDLAPFETEYHLGFQAVKNGDVIIVWGGTVAGEGSNSSNTGAVVAYDKDATTSGGEVAFENGTVKKLTAAEFQAAPKAAKK
jgi:hypothetical protein